MTSAETERALRAMSSVVWPQVRDGARRLGDRLGVAGSVVSRPEDWVQLALPSLQRTLGDLLARAVVLEMRVRRLQDGLDGDTGSERFARFLDRLCDPVAARAFLDEYPVLHRQVAVRIAQWVDAMSELHHNLAADRTALAAALSDGTDPGPCVAVRPGAGDRHRGGRTVATVTFASGLTVVAKPRPVAVDAHFQELLAWLGERGDQPPLRRLGVLDRGSRGWAEYVPVAPCADAAGVARFYRRSGALLAVLHLLCATDVHHQNVVAAGEHPVVVDLETLLHPVLFDLGDPAKRALEMSVQRVGLLPWRVLADGWTEGVDISGLGAATDVCIFGAETHWENPGTSDMVLAQGNGRRSEGMTHHRPRYGDGIPDVASYLDDVLTGFDEMYATLHRHRAALLADDGPLRRFDGDEVRVIVRHTHGYAVLERAILHPDALRDPAVPERMLDRLQRGAEAQPLLARIVEAEREQLRDGDIPLFLTSPASRDLRSSRGRSLGEIFAESSADLVRRRVAALGPADRARQDWIIRASYTGLVPAAEWTPPPPVPAPTVSGRAVTRDALLAAATAIGDRVAALACTEDGESSWIDLDVSREGRWTIAVTRPGLLDGLAGIALFLTRLTELTGVGCHRSLAQSAVTSLTRSLERGRISAHGVGAGGAGALFALAHGIPAPAGLTDELIDRLARTEPGDRPAGPGTVLALLAAHQAVASAPALELADRLGPGLRRPELGPRSAWALARLDAVTGQHPQRRPVRHGSGAPVDLLAGLRLGATGRSAADVDELPGDHSLWSGAAGRLDVLLEAASGDPVTHGPVLASRTAVLLAQAGAQGWRCATPGALETVTVRTGLAGIGYQLLRLAAPDRVPSLLALDPPAGS